MAVTKGDEDSRTFAPSTNEAKPKAGDVRTVNVGGRTVLQVYRVDPYAPIDSDDTMTWQYETSYADKDASAGGAGRNDALSAAQAALTGFLQAQSLADARKMSAMDNLQKLGQWAVPQGAKFAPNFEPGGLANTAYAVAGMKKFMPPPLQTRQVNPNDVAGEIPPEVRQMLGAIKSAGEVG